MEGAALVVLPRETFAGSATVVAPVLLGCVLEHETPEGLVAVALTEVEAYDGANDPASHAYRGRTERNAVMFGPPGHAYVYFTYGMHFCVNLVCLPEGTASAVLLRAGRVIEGVPLATARRARGGAARIAPRDLARGPARLCQALGIDRAQDGADVCDPGSPLRVRWPDQLDAGAEPDQLGAGAEPDQPGAGAEPDQPGAGAEPDQLGAGAEPDQLGDGAEVAAGRPGRVVVAGPDAVSWPNGARPGISQGPRVGISAAAERPWRFWLTGDPTVSAYRPHVPRRRPPGG